jgi:hypothetical protein
MIGSHTLLWRSIYYDAQAIAWRGITQIEFKDRQEKPYNLMING